MNATPVFESERKALGAAMLDTGAALDIADALLPSDYETVRHEHIHDAVTHLALSGAPHDAIAVSQLLTERGVLGQAGGLPDLIDIQMSGCVPSSTLWYATVIKDASVRRKIRGLGARLETIADTDGPPADVIAAARTELETLDAQAGMDEVLEPGDAIEAALASLDEPPGDPTPWPTMTRILAGLQPGRLYVPGARPGVGKSVFGLAIALDVAQRGDVAVVANLEMSRNEVWLRMLSTVGSVNGQRIALREIDRRDRANLDSAAEKLRKMPLVVACQPAMSPAQFEALVRTAARKGRVGCAVADYVGLFEPPASAANDNRAGKVGAITRALKVTALKHQVPVIAMSQLNRESANRTDKMPQLTDLRDSGSLEQDADAVILLHRDMGPDDDSSKLLANVAKNRSGPTAVIELIFQGHYSRISEGPTWGGGV